MANDTDADFPLLNAALPSSAPSGMNDAGGTDVSGLRVAVGEPLFPYRAFDNLDRIYPKSLASSAVPADPSPVLAGLGGIEPPPAPGDGGGLSGLAAAAAPGSSFPASAPSDAAHGPGGLAGLPSGVVPPAPAAPPPTAERASVRSSDLARGTTLVEMFAVLRRATPPAGPSDTSLRDIFR
ncbi:hypothetical protein HLH34_02990 [Gluconacetobacter azotocaptans]|uniref:Uncharacterized protein n=1 Tax=Gluconacetobacter azotocaptans TaxID=142834 RepID=A0A7W4JQN3_9PROT|nr:hypothetical protein [Gluconacetobacter azotocaptans]MBB2188930.1 hypothetical protein [Gluconacetobacter azotocaptans]MBM9401498.1 hypothetical protein [Gluconacetobacter azotocaptans]GBQ25981.1 hypothetical protein AA13594_0092 [Gluconacetobacter azotocaptans DSM 13594]